MTQGKGKLSKGLAVFLAAALTFAALPGGLLQTRAAGSTAVLYLDDGSIDITGTGYSVAGGTEHPYTGNYVITQHDPGTQTANAVTVENGTQNITLRDVNAGCSYSAFSILDGATVNLTLEGSSQITSYHDRAGIEVRQTATLTVTKSSTGYIKAYGSAGDDTGGGGAGIGGDSDGTHDSSGTINIEGGIVYAYGGWNNPGIGCGYGGNIGTINISGGVVTASGEAYSSGIGAATWAHAPQSK